MKLLLSDTRSYERRVRYSTEYYFYRIGAVQSPDGGATHIKGACQKLGNVVGYHCMHMIERKPFYPHSAHQRGVYVKRICSLGSGLEYSRIHLYSPKAHVFQWNTRIHF